MEGKDTLKSLRRKIEAIDADILRLLGERAQTAQEIGKAKSAMKMNPFDPRREEEVLRRVSEQNSGVFPQGAVASVFREIISGCRSLEVEMTVAYLGPPATYTHLACIEKFGSSIRTVPKESIPEIFEAVERETSAFGVVPIENSTEGVVNRTLDMLIESDVKICGEVLIRVSHDLLSRTREPKGIEKIYSHPQALGQCRRYLDRNFPGVSLVETVSTAKAAQMALEDPASAAIASPLASRLYGLEVMDARIEDYRNNYTRFLVLGRQDPGRTGKDKTSILFSIPDRPGSLYEILKPFSEKAVNLTKIESRPIKDKPWEYIFFVDFEGHTAEEKIAEAVSLLKERVLFLKSLGSYPRST